MQLLIFQYYLQGANSQGNGINKYSIYSKNKHKI